MNKKMLFMLPLFLLVLTGCHHNNPDEPEEPSCEHSSSTWRYDDEKHFQICENCSELFNEASHTKVERVTKTPTCAATGSKIINCQTCGWTAVETIAKTTEHTWDNGVITKEASDLEDGIMTYTCKICHTTKEVTFKNDEAPFKIELVHDEFIVGQYLEYTDISVVVREGNEYVPTTDFEFDLEGKKLTKNHTEVNVTWSGNTKTLPITVLDMEGNIEGIEVISRPDVVFTTKTKIEQILLYRYVYKNGGYSYYYNVPSREATVEQVENYIRFTINHQLGSEVFNKVVEIPNSIKGYSLTLPNKCIYAVGETFSVEGAKIDVNYNYGVSSSVVVTADMVDTKTLDMNTTGSYDLVVKYNDLELPFTVKVVNPVANAELVKALDSAITFAPHNTLKHIADSFEEKALELTYADESKEQVNVEESMLSISSWELGEQTVTLTYLDKVITFKVVIAFNGKTVSEIKNCEDGTSATITGIVIGFSYGYVPSTGIKESDCTINTVVKDMETSEWIIVTGLKDVIKGDVIEFNGVVTHTTNVEHQLKITGSNAVVVDHLLNSEDYKLDLSNAVTITNNDQWKETFKDANRINTFETVYKLHGNARAVLYNAGTYRICFPEVTSYGKQYFNSTLSGVFRSFMLEANTSYLTEEFFGTSTLFDEKFSFDKDIYVIYAGTYNSYYCDFVILDDMYIQDVEPIVKGYEILDPITMYKVGENLDLTGWVLKEQYIYGVEDNLLPITEDMVLEPGDFDPLVPGSYEFGIRYNGKVVTRITITYKEGSFTKALTIDGYSGAKYPKGTNLLTDLDTNGLVLTAINEENIGNIIPITQEMMSLVGYKIDEAGKTIYDELGYATQVIQFTYDGCSCTLEVKIRLQDTVNEIKKITAEKVSVDMVGVIISDSFAGNGTQTTNKTYPALVIKDLETNDYIVVRGVSGYTNGDVVRVQGKTAVFTSDAAGKGLIVVTDPTLTILCHTENPLIVKMDLSKAIEVAGEAELVELFGSASARQAAYGQLYKLNNARLVSYSGMYRLMQNYTDGSHPTGVGVGTGKCYVEGNLCPMLKVPTWERNCTKTFDEVFGVIGNYDALDSQNSKPCDIYVIFCGGVGTYYLDFVVLGDYCIGGNS